jgi:pimeloyl-ACP methyl ester carboxylesterase
MKKRSLVLYVHGKGGSAAEAEHYRPLFPGCEVIGLDYRAWTPWEAGAELKRQVLSLGKDAESVILIANSIGAFFCMNAGIENLIELAYFISPIVDMERLITDLMGWAGVSEAELEERGVIPTSFGEELSWAYLSYVRAHPLRWMVPTAILYASADHLTARDTMEAFARRQGASLTILEGGEHWFHTPEQMRFLDGWLTRELEKATKGT